MTSSLSVVDPKGKSLRTTHPPRLILIASMVDKSWRKGEGRGQSPLSQNTKEKPGQVRVKRENASANSLVLGP